MASGTELAVSGTSAPRGSPASKSRPVTPHPSRPGGAAAEYAEYSADTAERALAFLHDVLQTCVDHPKGATREWAAGPGRSMLNELP
jgi:hypothetical protein